MVEYREFGVLEHDPAHLGVDVRAVLVPVPGSEHVAGTEQLDRPPAEHVDLAGEQTMDDEESAVVVIAIDCAGGVPLARRQPPDPRQRATARRGKLIGVEQISEVRVGIDDADDVIHAQGDTRERQVRSLSPNALKNVPAEVACILVA